MSYQQLTLSQAATLLRCPERFLREQAIQGDLPCSYQGDQLIFNQEELLNWSSIHLLDSQKSKKKVHILSESPENRPPVFPSQLCCLEGISPGIDGKSKTAILLALTDLAEQTGRLYDSTEFYNAIREREQQAPTALPGGVAFVHPCNRDEFLFEDSFLCLAKANQPVFFGEDNGKTTDIFFVIACKDELHLPVLSRLGQLISGTPLLDELRMASTPEEMLNALRNAEGQAIPR